jgi:hypothetical protein
MVTLQELYDCVSDLVDELYADSHIPSRESRPLIHAALAEDVGRLGRLPTLYERECLVLGGPLDAEVTADQPDTGGEGNPDVDARFPRTSAAIKGMF